MNKEPEVTPPLPPLRRSNPIEEFLYPEGRRLDSPNPIGERVSKKFEQGGFIPTPSHTDITALRRANANLKDEVGILKGRVKSLEDVVLMLAKHMGIWEEVLTNLQ